MHPFFGRYLGLSRVSFTKTPTAGAGHNIVTTAVWKDEDAFQNAKKSAAAGFKKIGFNPQEIMKNLKVEIDRGVYRRSPY